MEAVIDKIRKVKEASPSLTALDDEKRKQVLLALADNLQKNSALILQENAKDLILMDKEDTNYDRLLLSKTRIDAIASDVKTIASLPASLGKILDEKRMPNGLLIQRISVPLGVVAVIYESRPNVTIDVFSLCFKTGNACILKGGKEAYQSSKVLVNIINQVLREHGIDPNVLYLLPPVRDAMQILLNAIGLVDVCIPRGSQALINFVRENAKIPVIETGAGIVHTYFDLNGDIDKGRLIIDNAKTRRVSVCNALDTLIINENRLSDLWRLVEPLATKNTEIFADEESYKVLKPVYPAQLLHKAEPEHFGREFLANKMSIKTVKSIQDAVDHIMHHTSGHSEAIITEDPAATTYFLNHVDAAAVYINASTAFTDGGQFGMGAEIGISTQKLHARGPMALDALTSYKWVIFGDGQIRV